MGATMTRRMAERAAVRAFDCRAAGDHQLADRWRRLQLRHQAIGLALRRIP